jgi:hypothetical protein
MKKPGRERIPGTYRVGNLHRYAGELPEDAISVHRAPSIAEGYAENFQGISRRPCPAKILERKNTIRKDQFK